MGHAKGETVRPTAQSVEAALIARIEELCFLRRLNDRLTAMPDYATATRTLVDLLHEELQAGLVAYVSVDLQRQVGRVEAVAPSDGAPTPAAPAEIALDGAPWAALLGTVEPTIVEGLAVPPWRPSSAGTGGTVLAAPTRVRDLTTGVLLVWESGTPDAMDLGEHRRLLAIVATFAALALDVARNQLREDFLAALRHDINNPVSAALGYTEMIVDALQSEEREDLLALASSIAESLKTVADLVSNYLSMAVIDRGTPWLHVDELDLGVLAAEVVRRFRPFAAERQVAIACQGQCPTLRADRRQLARVIGNLVSNAIKYTPRQGRVEVTVRRDADAAVLSVRDTGYGMAPEQVSELFGKYVRLHRDKGIPGTGLGLYISRAIVEAHGGTIAVTSERGVGSCFTVRLPRV